MKVSVSSCLPEKGRSDAIFGSLKEDQANGVCERGTCDGDNWSGIGSGLEPKGRGVNDMVEIVGQEYLIRLLA